MLPTCFYPHSSFQHNSNVPHWQCSHLLSNQTFQIHPAYHSDVFQGTGKLDILGTHTTLWIAHREYGFVIQLASSRPSKRRCRSSGRLVSSCHVRVSGMMPADVKGSKGLSRSSPMTVPLMGRVHSHLHPPGPSGHCETRLGYRDRGTYSRRAGRVTVTTHCKHSEKSKNK